MKPEFKCTKSSFIDYRVPYADTDQMSVVYYGNYLTYFERARSEVLRDMDFPYTELEKMGYNFPIVEAHVNYSKPAHYEDLLRFEGYFEWVNAVKFKSHHKIWRADDLLAQGYTIHACISQSTKKVVKFPSAFSDHFKMALKNGKCEI